MKKNNQRKNLFYSYYDTIFSSKNYSDEAKYFLSAAQKFYPSSLKKILEIGSGTGNHTIELAKSNAEITAIDTDKNMIEISLQKISPVKFQNIQLICTHPQKLRDTGFDAAFAGFFVVNYITDFNSLLSFFTAVQKRLKKNGIFIFDSWNGIAAMIDPPKSKITEVEIPDGKLVCLLTSQTDFLAQKTKLTYHVKILNSQKKEIAKDEFSFEMFLWTPAEITHYLNEAGFYVVKSGKHFNIEQSAEKNDWKMMFVCQKKS